MVRRVSNVNRTRRVSNMKDTVTACPGCCARRPADDGSYNALRWAGMSHRVAHRLGLVSLSLLLLAAARVDVAAQTSTRLVFDTFTGADHTRLAAHAPDVNQPGGAWTLGTLGPFPMRGRGA